MGVGAYISNLVSCGHKNHKRKQLQTVNLKVGMYCDGCALKLKKAMSSLKGVKSVEINRKEQKVTVIGYVDPSEVLRKAKSTGKMAEIWPYVNLVAQPYAPAAYDEEAPPGFVKEVDSVTTGLAGTYVTMFSDENPNACYIM